jgi:predicted RNA binding protein YcfA (HicA-like mRNA interferase family)
MPPLPIVTGKECLRVLRKLGYIELRIRGSHHMMFCRGRGAVAVPCHGSRPVPKGTLSNIIRQAGLTVEAFIELLK